MKRIILFILLSITFIGTDLLHAQSWSQVQKDGLKTLEVFKQSPFNETMGLVYRLDMKSYHKIAMQKRGLKATLSMRLPLPTGEFITVQFKENDLLPENLQEEYPMLKTWTGYYKGQAIYADYGKNGFHAMLLFIDGTVYIDPIQKGNNLYISYFKQDYKQVQGEWTCKVDIEEHRPVGLREMEPINIDAHTSLSTQGVDTTSTIKIFRLALACTGEYAQFYGGDTASVLAAMATTMNRVNGIYKREFGVVMHIVPENEKIIFLNPSEDPYNNDSSYDLLAENQNVVDNRIGTADYDIGHVFSTGGGGVAFLRSVCNVRSKASGVTGRSEPIGDPFDIDYVAHEMGHQFGGTHSFNNSCSGNRSDITAFEPGSGYSIMGYAGICSPNVREHSLALFHGGNILQMQDFINSLTCPVVETYTNSPPRLTLEDTFYIIPAGTPFFLEVSATDREGDNLTYSWEEYDIGIAPMPPVNSSVQGPMFEGFSPVESPRRYFPGLSSVLENKELTWEVLPTVSRNMEFGVTVRDNNVNSPRVSVLFVDVETYDTGEKFGIDFPSENYNLPEGSILEILWNTAGTQNAPINTPTVDIILLNNENLQVVDTIATDVPNDGAYLASFNYPMDETYRLFIQGHGNIFYNVSGEISIGQGMNLSLIADRHFCPGIPDTVRFVIPGLYEKQIAIELNNLPQGIEYTLVPNSTYGNDTVMAVISYNGNNVPVGDYELEARFEVEGIKDSILFNYVISESELEELSGLTVSKYSDTQFRLEWDAIPGVVSYRVQFSGNAAFNPVLKDTVVEASSPLIMNAVKYGVNYIRIRGADYCDMTDWVVREIYSECGVFNLLTEASVNAGRWNEYSSQGSKVLRKGDGEYEAFLGTEGGENESSVSITYQLPVEFVTGEISIPYTIDRNSASCASTVRVKITDENDIEVARETLSGCSYTAKSGLIKLNINCAEAGDSIHIVINSINIAPEAYFTIIQGVFLQTCKSSCSLFIGIPTAISGNHVVGRCVLEADPDFQYFSFQGDSVIAGIKTAETKLGAYKVGVRFNRYSSFYETAQGEQVALLGRSFTFENVDQCQAQQSFTARLFFTRAEYIFLAYENGIKSVDEIGVSMIALSDNYNLNKQEKTLLPTSIPSLPSLPSNILAIDVQVPNRNGILILHALTDTLADVWYDLTVFPQGDSTIYTGWTVRKDENISVLYLERSLDNENFEEIDSVLFTGGETFPYDMSYIDADVEVNTEYFYRIKIVDSESEIYYSPSESAIINPTSLKNPGVEAFSIYPNPHHNSVTFKIEISGTYKIEIYDTYGRMVDELNYKGTSIRYNSYSLSAGVYYIRLYENGVYKGTAPFVKI